MAELETVREVRDTETARGPVIAARVVYWIFGVIIAFIVLRMILMLLGANQGSPFVDLIYTVSGIFVAPFYGVFNYTPLYGFSVFDINSLIAIIVYALVGWAIGSLLTIGSRSHHAAA